MLDNQAITCYYYNDYNCSIMKFLVVSKYRVPLLTKEEYARVQHSILFSAMNHYGVFLSKEDGKLEISAKGVKLLICYQKKSYDIYKILKELNVYSPHVLSLSTIFAHHFQLNSLIYNVNINIYNMMNARYSQHNLEVLQYCNKYGMNLDNIDGAFIDVYKKRNKKCK